MSSSLTPAQSYVLPLPGTELPGNLTQAQFIQTVMAGVSGLPGRPRSSQMAARGTQAARSSGRLDGHRHLDEYAGCELLRRRRINRKPSFPSVTNCSRYPAYLWTERSGDDASYPGRVPGSHEPRRSLLCEYGIRGSLAGQASAGPRERTLDRPLRHERFLRAETIRTYPVLTLFSASGTIYVPDITADYMLAWTVPHS